MSGQPTVQEFVEIIDELVDGYADHLLGCPMLSRELPCDCGYRALLGRAEHGRQAAGAPPCQHPDTTWHTGASAAARPGAEFCRRCGASRPDAGDPWRQTGSPAGRPMVVWVSDEAWESGLTEARGVFVWGELRRLVRSAREEVRNGNHERAARLLTSARCTSLIAPDALMPDTPHPPDELDDDAAEPGYERAAADARCRRDVQAHEPCRHRRFQFVQTPGVVAAWVGWELCHDCGATRSVDGDHTGAWRPSETV
ncbi:MAG: hypothetical protein JWR63_1265 [Conexibacter sp.]|nr:hypothetical protein [Conexibacter sp.]